MDENKMVTETGNKFCCTTDTVTISNTTKYHYSTSTTPTKTTSSLLSSLPSGRFQLPMTPRFFVLCFFLQFAVSVVHPSQHHLPRSSPPSFPYHSLFYDFFQEGVSS